MAELLLSIDEELAERLASAAAERGTSVEPLAADVVSRHVSAPAEADRQLEDPEITVRPDQLEAFPVSVAFGSR